MQLILLESTLFFELFITELTGILAVHLIVILVHCPQMLVHDVQVVFHSAKLARLLGMVPDPVPADMGGLAGGHEVTCLFWTSERIVWVGLELGHPLQVVAKPRFFGATCVQMRS